MHVQIINQKAADNKPENPSTILGLFLPYLGMDRYPKGVYSHIETC